MKLRLLISYTIVDNSIPNCILSGVNLDSQYQRGTILCKFVERICLLTTASFVTTYYLHSDMVSI